MKKFILMVTLSLFGFAVSAQSGYKFINFSGGLLYPGAYNLSVNYEFVGKYHNTWELGGEYYVKKETLSSEHPFRSPYNWMIGPVFKPVLSRSKNVTFRFPMGFRAGSNRIGFIAAPQMGFELSRTFSSEVEILITQKNQYVFFESQNNWRIGILVGLKIPLN
jgi:hypothetical protein